VAVALLLLVPAVALGQTDVDATDSATVTDLFAAAGLSDDDLVADLEAENLPTTDRFGYWWENVRNNVVSVFTFNAERKSAQYNERLHTLDRKLAACAELGDENCVARVEERLIAVQDRAEIYIANQEELAEAHAERFAAWREARADHIAERHTRAEELQDTRSDLIEARKLRRSEAQDSRRSRVQDVREVRVERRDAIQDNQLQRRSYIQDAQLERRDTINTKVQEVQDQVAHTLSQYDQINHEENQGSPVFFVSM
jgi:hypothetical protein